MSAKADYDRSRYERARDDLREQIERDVRQDFEASAPVRLLELAERFVIAVEAIARAKGVPASNKD